MASLAVTIEQVGAIASVVHTSAAEVPAESESEPLSSCDPDAAARAAEADPLTIRAREYASGGLRVLQALRPRLMRRGDSASMDAADRLEETCITVASKIHRAISSAFTSVEDPADVQVDANGSAKVALLVIEESRQAWRTLMRPGFAVGNGAPAGFLETLDVLEAGLHTRFPRALEFVRPGFDTSDGSLANAWACALDAGPGPTRH
ncbi:MAG TPA: hypothetical protein VN700_04535 [Vicinamibacterales bacterium]|nr:hypothetical protein [Vicinamibacterales bacterium]